MNKRLGLIMVLCLSCKSVVQLPSQSNQVERYSFWANNGGWNR